MKVPEEVRIFTISLCIITISHKEPDFVFLCFEKKYFIAKYLIPAERGGQLLGLTLTHPSLRDLPS